MRNTLYGRGAFLVLVLGTHLIAVDTDASHLAVKLRAAKTENDEVLESFRWKTKIEMMFGDGSVVKEDREVWFENGERKEKRLNFLGMPMPRPLPLWLTCYRRG